MANYCAAARSNYFKVKDTLAFVAWVDTIQSLGYWEQDDKVAIYSDCPDGGGWPSYRYDEEKDDHVDIDLTDELSEHLVEGEVAVLVEAGHEKLRYVIGQAIAVNWKGEYEIINLDRIYDLAFERWGVKPTHAEY